MIQSETNNLGQFRLFTAIYLKKYEIDGKIMKPMLRVATSGEVYFIHSCGKTTLKEVLDNKDRELFFKSTQKRFDYHYDLIE